MHAVAPVDRDYLVGHAEFRHPGHPDQSVHGSWAKGADIGEAPSRPRDKPLVKVSAPTQASQKLVDAAVDMGALDGFKVIHDVAHGHDEVGSVNDTFDMSTVKERSVRQASAAITEASQRALVDDGFPEEFVVYRRQRGADETGVVSVSTRPLGYLEQSKFSVQRSDVLTYGEALQRGTYAENELHVDAGALTERSVTLLELHRRGELDPEFRHPNHSTGTSQKVHGGGGGGGGEFDTEPLKRGLNVQLSDSEWAEVHRLLQPPMTKDQIDQHLKIGPMLVEKVSGHEVQGEKVGLGRHWTSSDNMAETAAMAGGVGGLPVIITARGRSSEIEANPQQLVGHNFSGEAETTFVKGAEFEVLDVQILVGQRWESVWPDGQQGQRSTELRHPGHPDQSVHGKWAHATSSMAEPDGGFTIDRDGKPVTTGWSVGIKGSTVPIDASEITTNRPKVRAVLVQQMKALPEDASGLGGWHDPETGIVHIDHVKIFPKDQHDTAAAFAKANNQKAMANLDAIAAGDWDNAIEPTGGTGDLGRSGSLSPHGQAALHVPVRQAPVGDDRRGARGTGRQDPRHVGRGDRRRVGAAFAHVELRHPNHQTGTDQSVHGGMRGASNAQLAEDLRATTQSFADMDPEVRQAILDQAQHLTGLSEQETYELFEQQAEVWTQAAIDLQDGNLEAVMQEALFYERWHDSEVSFVDQFNEAYPDGIDGQPLTVGQQMAASSALANARDPAVQVPNGRELALALAQDRPITVTQADIDSYNAYFTNTKGEMRDGFERVEVSPGTIKPSDLPAGFIATRLRFQMPDGTVHAVTKTRGTIDMVKGIEILRGRHPNEYINPDATPGARRLLLNGAKIRDYAAAGVDPRASTWVQDTWMSRGIYHDIPLQVSGGVWMTPAQIKASPKVASPGSVIQAKPNAPTAYPKQTGTYPLLEYAGVNHATPAVNRVMRENGYTGPELTSNQSQAVMWAGIRNTMDTSAKADPFAPTIVDSYFRDGVLVDGYVIKHNANTLVVEG